MEGITHVIHYTLPVEAQIYIHRSGRTARAGKSGIRSNMIGAIDLDRDFSYFEVEARATRHAWNSVNNANLDGRTVQVRQVTCKKKRYKGQQRLS